MGLCLNKFKNIFNNKPVVKQRTAYEILEEEFIRMSHNHDLVKNLNGSKPKGFADKYKFADCKGSHDFFNNIFSGIKEVAGGIEVTLKDIFEILQKHYGKRQSTAMLGLFTSAAVELYAENARSLGNSKVSVVFNGNGMKVDYLFSYIKSVDEIEVENVNGNEICAWLTGARKLTIKNCSGIRIAKGVSSIESVELNGIKGNNICSDAQNIEKITLSGCFGDMALSRIRGDFKDILIYKCFGLGIMSDSKVWKCRSFIVVKSSCDGLFQNGDMRACDMVLLKSLQSNSMFESAYCKSNNIIISECSGLNIMKKTSAVCNFMHISKVWSRFDLTGNILKFQMIAVFGSGGFHLDPSRIWRKIPGKKDTDPLVYISSNDYYPYHMQKDPAEFLIHETGADLLDNILVNGKWDIGSLYENVLKIKNVLDPLTFIAGSPFMEKIKESKCAVR